MADAEQRMTDTMRTPVQKPTSLPEKTIRVPVVVYATLHDVSPDEAYQKAQILVHNVLMRGVGEDRDAVREARVMTLTTLHPNLKLEYPDS